MFEESWGTCYVDPGSAITTQVESIILASENKFVIEGIVPVSMCEVKIDMNVLDRHGASYHKDARTSDENGKFLFEYNLEEIPNLCDSHKVVLDYAGLKTTSEIDMYESSLIPSWVKVTAGAWADGKINDTEFVMAMEFLINEGILNVTVNTQGSESDLVGVPDWIKNNSGWWADCHISDSDFTHGIEFLIKNRIISIK